MRIGMVLIGDDSLDARVAKEAQSLRAAGHTVDIYSTPQAGFFKSEERLQQILSDKTADILKLKQLAPVAQRQRHKI